MMCEQRSSLVRILLRLSLTGRGGLARVDMSNDNDVDVKLFLTAKNRGQQAGSNKNEKRVDPCWETVDGSK